MTRLALIFSLLFVTPAWAEWRLIGNNMVGNEYYLDFDKIRASKGYVYYWSLINFLEPRQGAMSSKQYYKGDCDALGNQMLQVTPYFQPMGVEKVDSFSVDPEWYYLDPDGIGASVLRAACREAGFKK